jgi:hypothetical protein
MATRRYVYQGSVIEQPVDVSIEEVKQAMSDFFPELANADYEVDADGTVRFVVRAASKGAGMRKYIYQNNVIEQPADLPIEDVKDVLAEFFPELANADYSLNDNGDVVFTVRAASKGM